MNLCKDCKWVIHPIKDMAALCDHQKAEHNYYDGTPYEECQIMRSAVFRSICGEEGKLFEPNKEE